MVEAAVVPSADHIRWHVPKAFITLKPGLEPSRETAREIFTFIRGRLASYKRVRRIEFAELPKTVSGKIRRVQLRKHRIDTTAGTSSRGVLGRRFRGALKSPQAKIHHRMRANQCPRRIIGPIQPNRLAPDVFRRVVRPSNLQVDLAPCSRIRSRHTGKGRRVRLRRAAEKAGCMAIWSADAVLPLKTLRERLGCLAGLSLLWLEITRRCNLTCAHCYVDSGP